MSLAVSPTDYLKANLDPLSHAIDGFGGPHVLLGLIASDGHPHIYVVGNMKDTLRKEAYEALGDLLKSRASQQQVSSISAGQGTTLQ